MITKIKNYYKTCIRQNIRRVECSGGSPAYKYLRSSLFCISKGFVQIPHIDISVGMVCTLKCKYCTQWIPYIKDPKLYSFESIKRNMEKLLKNVDYIHRVALIGGEPFVNREFDKIAKWIISQDKIGQVLVITNSTIVPPAKWFKTLRNPKVLIWANHYDNSPQYEQIISLCRKYGVRYSMQHAEQWYDLGILESGAKHAYTENELKHVLSNCWLRNCATLIGDSFYRCPRTWVLENNGIEEPGKDEKICIKNLLSKWDTFKKLYRFYSLDYINACRWCNDEKHRKAIKPAEQCQNINGKDHVCKS